MVVRVIIPQLKGKKEQCAYEYNIDNSTHNVVHKNSESDKKLGNK
jgi:hypothetical protein